MLSSQEFYQLFTVLNGPPYLSVCLSVYGTWSYSVFQADLHLRQFSCLCLPSSVSTDIYYIDLAPCYVTYLIKLIGGIETAPFHPGFLPSGREADTYLLITKDESEPSGILSQPLPVQCLCACCQAVGSVGYVDFFSHVPFGGHSSAFCPDFLRGLSWAAMGLFGL